MNTIIPRIVVDDPASFITFLRNVFGAAADLREGAPAQVTIGDSLLLVSETGQRAAFPAFLYVYVDDADATCKKAVKSGAVSIEEVWDTPYGDRRGMVTDRWNNIWQIASRGQRS